jgi:prophage DNA circulation protein
MTTIFDASPGAVWRQELMPASFRGAYFHCESNARESGRRIVEHEFPKKDYPYAEDMGRHFREFTIRGYCIVFPVVTDQQRQLLVNSFGHSQQRGVPVVLPPPQWQDPNQLFVNDYRIPRDLLLTALETEGPGDLQLPTQQLQSVVCTRYRLTEEEKFGGYCVFDMTFQEYGVDPLLMVTPPNTAQVLAGIAAQLRSQVQRALQPPNPSIGTGEPTSTSTTIST